MAQRAIKRKIKMALMCINQLCSMFQFVLQPGMPRCRNRTFSMSKGRLSPCEQNTSNLIGIDRDGAKSCCEREQIREQ